MKMRENQVDYRNWVPGKMIFQFTGSAFLLGAGSIYLKKRGYKALSALLAAGAVAGTAIAGWSAYARRQFSYKGRRKFSKGIVEGTANYVNIPEGGIGLDVGCGSGALTIACAKRNPGARMVGCDRWGAEYSIYNKRLCQRTAKAEGVANIRFCKGDATSLPFRDETFDAVCSNYVYHNIVGHDKQELLLETLRVLKKGGTFAIHDIMSRERYGDMKHFLEKLKGMGYESVILLDTDQGLFMNSKEAAGLFLKGSSLLYGRK